MLHDIPVSDLGIGMYVVGFDRPWMEVPFWRRRFPVSDAAMLRRVVESGVTRVIVDDTRGRGPARALPAELPVGLGLEDAPVHAAPAEERRRKRRTVRVDELTLAREAVERSKQAVAQVFGEARLGRSVTIDQVTPLVDDIAACVERDPAAILSVTRLKDWNEYTYIHSIAVSALMMTLARALGLSPGDVREAGLGGLLHDIGKAKVPQSILDKVGPLTREERGIVQAHPEEGHRMLGEGGGVSPIVRDICLHHHERMDGTGYPFGLTGDRLSVFARMAAICDVYDAITSQRPYKRGWSPAEALRDMGSWTGHFDERLFRRFVTAIGIYPLGALVRLRSNRLALVLSEERDRPDAPVVRSFFGVEQGHSLPVADGVAAGDDPILRMEAPEQWFAEDWATLSDRLRAAEPGQVLAVSVRAAAA